MTARILVVSGDASKAESVRGALAAAEHTVQVAADVEHGLSVTRTFLPRVIVLDGRFLALGGRAPGVVQRFRDASSGPIAVVSLGHEGGHAEIDAFVARAGDDATLLATIAATIGERPTFPTAPRFGARILVLEGSRAMRAHFRGVLEARGYRVLEAASIEEAASMVRRERPDLILEDVMLLDARGLELTQLVRAMPGGATVPIVGISAQFPADDASNIAIAFDAFLAKPVEPERLIETVDKLLPAPAPPAQRELPELLLVDDDPVQLKLARIYLANAGFRVTSSGDATTALERARVETPRVIVADVLMSGTDGFELALAVREDEALRDVPVVLMSASFDREDLALVEGVGAHALVARTPDFADVIEAVRTALDRGPPQRSTRERVPSKIEREKRLIQRLVGQTALNASLAQRCATQEAQLSILGAVADALAASVEVKTVLQEVLARCLDTSGLSKGALFRVGPGARLALGDSVGFEPSARPELETAFGHLAVLERVLREETALVLTPGSSPGGDALLARARAASAIVVPLVGAGHRLGVLLLLSDAADPVRRDLVGFSKAITAYTGQAMALASAFGRLSEAERKNEILSVLAHELRGPLAPIMTAAAVLQHKPDDTEAVARASTTIARQAHHLARMADDLLDASLLAHGKVKVVRERLDLVALAREVTADQKDAHDDAGVALSLSSSNEAFPIVGDRTRLAQALGSLLANAVKFTPRGGQVHVDVSARGSHEVALSVRDTGAGIPAEMIERLFAPFVQGDHTLERARGGLGLGLAVVKGVIDLHGGRVTASSPGPGAGAEVTIVLPSDAGSAPLADARDLPPPTAAGGSPIRILVIDDNRDTALTLIEFLDAMGYTTDVAHDGRKGVEKALEWRPDVVLCDIGLPGMDGYAVAAALHGLSGVAPVKLVALTGYGSEADIARARAAGFVRHLTKPVTPDALLAALAELVVPPVASITPLDFSGGFSGSESEIP